MHPRFLRRLTVLAIGFTAANASAQVVTDGTLGAATSLTGPRFDVGAQLGRQVGSNLFHSFQQFDVASGQMVTFSGPAAITNVVSRVTGGAPSTIDGTVRLTGMPSADFWFVNPAGVTFGANASLDVPGSVYVSTADYLVLGIDGRFDASAPSASRLSVAAPSAFGFLDASIGTITLDGAQLDVAPQHALGFVGGDFNATGATLLAPSGVVQIGAVASRGEAVLAASGRVDYSAFGTLGDVAISSSQDQIDAFLPSVDVTGDAGGGSVFVQGDTLRGDSLVVTAENLSDTDGGIVALEFRGQVTLDGATAVSTSTFGAGDAGDIRITGSAVTARGTTEIRSDTRSTGNGGDIDILAGSVLLGEAARVSSNSSGAGDGGRMRIAASGAFELIDDAAIRTEARFAGDAGAVAISARTIDIRGNGTIQASTFVGSSGDGGPIELVAAEQFTLIGTGLGVPGTSALVSSAARGSGDAGTVTIDAPVIIIDGLAQIETTATSGGDAGAIDISADAFDLAGSSAIDSRSSGSGNGGPIDIAAQSAVVRDGARISSAASGTGLAGDVSIAVAGDFVVSDSRIETSAAVSDGGNVMLAVLGDFLLDESTVQTSVRSGVGNGGNVTIAAPELFVLRDSRVEANAFGGAGGNIDVTADFIVASSPSRIEASSELGIDGVITLSTPEVDVAALVSGPDARRLDDSAIPATACRTDDEASRLIVGSAAWREQLRGCN